MTQQQIDIDTIDEAVLRRRAENNDVWAMAVLGYRLNKHRATRGEAVNWWRKAAEAGDVYAMSCLATAGWRVEKSEREQWWALASATKRGRGTDPVPAEVTAEAAAADLGDYEAIFGPGYGSRLSGRKVGPVVWVFARGLVLRELKSGALRVFPWERCHIRREVTRNTLNGSYTCTDYRYTLTHDSGAKQQWWGRSGQPGTGEVWVLGDRITREINKIRLPRAIDALEAGRRLDFGPLGLDLGHIYNRNVPLAWPEVESITVRSGYLRVKRAGKTLAWAKKPIGAIPDVDVLLGIARALVPGESRSA